MATKNIRCACEHAYQDAMCGSRSRIHVSQSDDTWQCTICGALKDAKGKPVQPDRPDEAGLKSELCPPPAEATPET